LDEIGLGVYEEMSFKVKVYGRRTDGRRTDSDHKSSPCHKVTGELKMEDVSKMNSMSEKINEMDKKLLLLEKQDKEQENITCFFMVSLRNKMKILKEK
jgi:hypothetical protein